MDGKRKVKGRKLEGSFSERKKREAAVVDTTDRIIAYARQTLGNIIFSTE
jgi:hypothetical protein